MPHAWLSFGCQEEIQKHALVFDGSQFFTVHLLLLPMVVVEVPTQIVVDIVLVGQVGCGKNHRLETKFSQRLLSFLHQQVSRLEGLVKLITGIA